jgi:hypothetical protein
MNKEKKRKASGQLLRAALPSPRHSIVLVDPKGELSAVMTNRFKKNRRAPLAIDPFVVLPSMDKFQQAHKWFRLCVATALRAWIRKQKREGNERQQRKSKRAH